LTIKNLTKKEKSKLRRLKRKAGRGNDKVDSEEEKAAKMDQNVGE